MTKDYLAYHPDPRRPSFVAPPGACDAHCHVFGPVERFPFAASRTYTPVDAPKEMLFALHRHLGFDRAVLVQASCHGTDNGAMLDAIAAGEGRYRGVAMVEPTADRGLLRSLHDGGVRALRFNFVKHLGADAAADAMRRFAPHLADLGWHVVVHFDADRIDDVGPLLVDLPVPVIIDHMGRIDASRGLDQPAFQRLVALMANERIWVKVCGADRVTRQGPPYQDAAPFARTLVERFGDRVLWGTDWPHPNARPPMPDDGELVDLLPLIAPTTAQRQALLVDNPTRLYWTD